MRKNLCLGLIGELGVGAAMPSYQKLGEGHEEQGRILNIGTDLTVLFNEANTGFPHIDCGDLPLKALLNGLLSEAPCTVY